MKEFDPKTAKETPDKILNAADFAAECQAMGYPSGITRPADILPTAPNASSGTSQSRPDSARPVKVIESGGALTQRNAVAGGGKRAEKPKSATGAPASICHCGKPLNENGLCWCCDPISTC